MRMARLKDPYTIIPMENESFVYFKKMNKSIFNNPKVNTEGEKVNWLKICCLKLTRDSDVVQYKYRFTDEFKVIPLVRKTTRNTSENPVHLVATKLYEAELTISTNKKKDLMDLCDKGLIPQEYHQYYQSLKSDDMPEMIPEIEEFISEAE